MNRRSFLSSLSLSPFIGWAWANADLPPVSKTAKRLRDELVVDCEGDRTYTTTYLVDCSDGDVKAAAAQLPCAGSSYRFGQAVDEFARATSIHSKAIGSGEYECTITFTTRRS